LQTLASIDASSMETRRERELSNCLSKVSQDKSCNQINIEKFLISYPIFLETFKVYALSYVMSVVMIKCQ
jgi:hypothetical protein